MLAGKIAERRLLTFYDVFIINIEHIQLNMQHLNPVFLTSSSNAFLDETLDMCLFIC